MTLRKVVVGGLTLAMLLVPLGVAQAQTGTQAAPTVQGITVPITGTGAGGSSFAGSFDITRFTSQNHQLSAVGTLTGTLTDSLGGVLGTVNQQITLPVGDPSGSCPILHLTLGPLDLNLLGLMVHLDQVVLDITAQQGSGNLLGNLLCAVAHLLDNTGGATGGLAALLNEILGILGSL